MGNRETSSKKGEPVGGAEEGPVDCDGGGSKNK